MKISFLGATNTVTGSKYLLECGHHRILLDCGLFQGLKELRLRNWDALPIPANSITAVVLTHAHIDHSGYLPRLVKDGFRGKIYCTPATFDLCKVLLPDAAHLQEEDARYANKKAFSKHHPALPLFTVEDAQNALTYFRTVDYRSTFELSGGLSFEFRNAGHILGAANVTFHDGKRSLCFSGDVGRSNDALMHAPETPEEADFLVIESTYGDMLHPSVDTEEELCAVISRTAERQGTVIIPAFSVGRTQSVLYYLSRLKKAGRINLPVFLNSPMSINVTKLFDEYRSLHKLTSEQCDEMCKVAAYINNSEDSIKLNADKQAKIIISASGMATGGRVIHHIKTYAPDPKNTILFTGFQAQGTRGDKMLRGSQTIKIHGIEVPVQAEVQNLVSLSAHADRNELLEWVKGFKVIPRRIFITHGEPEASLSLKHALDETFRMRCELPKYMNSYEL
jgi:metallo-beta-lactamase family protein